MIDGEKAIQSYVGELEYGGSRESDLYQFWEWCLENDVEFLRATHHDLEAWASDLDDEDYAGRTIREKISSVRGLYNTLQRSQENGWEWPVPRRHYYVDPDDPETIDLSDYALAPRTWIENPKSALYIRVDEYKQMLDTAELPRDELLLRILWETGIRAKEASNIKISHVSDDRKSIEIRSAKKTETADPDELWRTVFLPESTAVRLRKWMDKGVRLKYSEAEASPYLFVTLRSPKMEPNSVNRRVKKVAERAGIQRESMETADGRSRGLVSSHTLRRSFAVHRVKNGMPIVTLAELLGHSLMETSRIYTKFVNADLKKMNRRYRP